MATPSHPDINDSSPEHQPAAGSSRTTRLVVTILAATVAVILLLHLTGVVGPNR
jgi:hypothetical protein